jgi:hypothetical protein
MNQIFAVHDVISAAVAAPTASFLVPEASRMDDVHWHCHDLICATLNLKFANSLSFFSGRLMGGATGDT